MLHTSLISCRGDKKSNRISRLWNVETPDKSAEDNIIKDVSLTLTNDSEQNGNSVEMVIN